MSKTNMMDKSLRRQQRTARKARAAHSRDSKGKHIPHGGVLVTKEMVKSQRYNRMHDLPFSKSVANVTLRHDLGISDDEAAVILNRG